MKKIIILGSLALFMASCSDSLVEDQAYSYSDGEGGVSIAIETQAITKAGTDLSGNTMSQFETSVLKIYDSSNSLIRNYEPATDVPSTLFFVSGSYSLSLNFGSGNEMTTDGDDLTYYGASNFAISAGSTTSVGVTCSVENTVVGVEFDLTTLDEYLVDGYSVTLTPESMSGKSLNFTTDGKGYFILPETSKEIAWQFDGVRESDGSSVLVSGVISEANAGEENTLTFRYVNTETDQYVDFIGGITVDTSVTEYKDTFITTDEDLGVDTDTTDPDVTDPDVTDPDTTDPDPEITDPETENSGDITGTIGTATTDLWNNSVAITASLSSSEFTTATIQVRESGETAWQTATLSASGDSYVATVAASWTSATNDAGLTYYTPSGGVWAGTTYECQLVVDGEVLDSSTFGSTTNGVQTISDGDLNSSDLYCYSTSNGGSTWDSGNFSITLFGTTYYWLCSQETVGSATCAKLETTTCWSVIAAGNIFYGDFKYSGTAGTVSFGRPFTWESRPRTLKVKYAASLASGSIEDPIDGTKYDQDRARIFLAIVDWDSQRAVTSGTSDPTGTWDPASQISTDEGDIIGYASMFIDESTSTDGLIQLELPIHYYDTETKPSEAYSLVISCASSAYGDYKVGVKGSILYVDDFEFGY